MSNKLHVSNVPITAGDDDLRVLFAAYGTVHSAHMEPDAVSEVSSKTGLVEMDSDREGDAAIAGLDGCQFGGRLLTVTWATTRHESDADHSSLFSPMNMITDEPGHERCDIAPADARVNGPKTQGMLPAGAPVRVEARP